MEERVFDIISEIIDVKKSTGRVPSVASLTEITNSIMIEVKEAINSLYRAGKITWHENVNGVKMFSIKEG